MRGASLSLTRQRSADHKTFELVEDGGPEGLVPTSYVVDKQATQRQSTPDLKPGWQDPAQLPDTGAWCVCNGVPAGNGNTVWRWPPWDGILSYLRKWAGGRQVADNIPTLETIVIATIGAFMGILAVSSLNLITLPHAQLDEAVPSFGATAVLIYGAFEVPFAQPRNVLGGQVLSAIVGCSFRVAFGAHMFWLSAPLAMSLALTLMLLTRTVHPPGGATAFIASTRPVMLPSHGFRFVGGVAIGTIIMLMVATLVDNLHHNKRYPKMWFGSRHKESWLP